MKQTNKSALLLITAILTYINIFLSISFALGLTFNVFNMNVWLKGLLMRFYSDGVNIDSQITMIVIEMVFVSFINIYFARVYTQVYKYRVNNKNIASQLIKLGLFQMLFAGLIPGIMATIAGSVMLKKRPKASSDTHTNSFLSDIKLTVMSDAVTRLKELRAKGVISEDEYYANLDKILEG